MPWLSRQNSAEDVAKTAKSARTPVSTSRPSNAVVSFIPAMIDGSCGTSPATHRKPLLQTVLGEAKIMAQNIWCLPEMMRSILSMEMARNIFGSWMNLRDLGLQAMLAVIEMWMLVMMLPAFLAMPGLAFGVLSCAFTVVIAMLSWPLKGEQVIRYTSKEHRADQCGDERWIYINGAMTSHHQMRSHLMHLSSIFCRPMIGIHNRTNGIILDLLSMLLSNMLPMNRSTSRVMYSQLRDCLLDSSVRKVIIISHGTGAAILSNTLDYLHADLPIDVLSKIEIYTFGSAATHLSNPCVTLNSPMNSNPAYTRADGSIVSPVKTTLASRGNRVEDTERVIPHIEHYALSTDFFARCGIMHHTRSVLDNTFCGREFIVNPRSSATTNSSSPSASQSSSSSGFMFSQYLNMLFPPAPTKSFHTNSILDERIEVDIQTAEKREFTAQGVSMPLQSLELGKRSSSGSFPSSPTDTGSFSGSANGGTAKAEKRASIGRQTMGSEGVAQARMCAKECEGKTVRQLSRLWRYAGGARPVGEGVGVTNGVGLGLNEGHGHGVM